MRCSLLNLVAGSMMLCSVAAAQNITTAFTYQGRIESAGQPANGLHDLRFRLFTPLGVPVGSTLCVNDVSVVDGLFTTSLDFGAVFTGQQLLLEMDVRPDTGLSCADTTGYSTLAPRQAIVAAPYALMALNASTLGGLAPTFYTNAANMASGTIPDARLATTVARTNTTQTFTGAITMSNAANAFTGSGAGLTTLNATNLASGTLADTRLSANVARRDVSNTFAASNTFSAATVFNANVGIGTAATFPVTVGTTAQTAAQFSGSNTGGTWLNLINTAAGGRTWNIISSGPTLGEGAGTFFVRDANAPAVRMLIDTAGNMGLNTTAPGERLEVFGPDATVRVRNSNDTGGAFVMDTFSTLQLGLYNPTAAAWGAVAANTKQSMFGVQNTGRVGTLTNTSGVPVWRNVIDDGFGNATFTGTVATSVSSVSGGAMTGTQTGLGSFAYGVYGLAPATGASSAVGVRGEARGNSGFGVYGSATSTTGQAYGVVGVGVSTNTLSSGVYGESANGNAVQGYSTDGKAIYGRSDRAYGVYAQTAFGGQALYAVRTTNNNRAWLGGLNEAGWAESPTGTGFVAKTGSGNYALYAERNPGGSTPNVNRGWFGSLNEGAWAESDQGNGLVALSRGLNSAAVYCRNDAGGRALFADGVAAVRALDILGGADLAEPFDVSETHTPVPGMVVSIDPEHAGDLRVSTEAYDTKVAGIISGANGLSPGMTMRDENGLHVDGKHPVAMTGRVWCYADASELEIKPGDRLTTSATPGHAMRADDVKLAPGSVIGKAMTPLAKGEKGLVLVLVNLQ